MFHHLGFFCLSPVVYFHDADVTNHHPGGFLMSGAAQVEAEPKRTNALVLRGSAAYVAWFAAIRKKTRISKSELVRAAMEEWSQRHGHPAPPES